MHAEWTLDELTADMFIKWLEHQVFVHQCVKAPVTCSGCYPAPERFSRVPGAITMRVLLLKDILPLSPTGKTAFPVDEMTVRAIQHYPNGCVIVVDAPDDCADYIARLRREALTIWQKPVSDGPVDHNEDATQFVPARIRGRRKLVKMFVLDEGLTDYDVAQRLGCSPETVKSDRKALHLRKKSQYR